MKIKFVSPEKFYETYRDIPKSELEQSREILEADFDLCDFEVKFAYCSGCILLRYYSDESGYHFDAPFALSGEADVGGAFIAITEYCIMQRIPETVIGIEEQFLNLMLRGAESYSITQDEDGTSLVRINTECMNCEYLPEYLSDDVYLGEFSYSYAEDYEKMLKNEKLNLHYGYNIVDDIPNGNGIDFINSVKNEFENGEAMTFAATILEDEKNKFVGEGVLYGFDGRGRAFAAFRVMPEHQRKGVGFKILLGLMEISRRIGIKLLTAEVMAENLPSIALLRKLKEPIVCEDKLVFEFDLSV